MRDLCRRRLILSGLGAAALAWPPLPAAAQTLLSVEASMPEVAEAVVTDSVPTGAAIAEGAESSESAKIADITEPAESAESAQVEGTESAQVEGTESTQPSASPQTAEPAASSESTVNDEPSTSPSPSTEEDAAAETLPLQGGTPEGNPSPDASTPTALPEEPVAQPVNSELDYLNPHSNPLRLQTRPAEVEILGTQPLALEDAIELAYRNSEELRIAQLQLERSYEGLRAERALLYPTADLSATLEVTDQTNFGLGLGNTATRLNSGIRAEYDLGVSGERSARIQAAEEQVRLAELAMERTREELRLNTTTDYYAVQDASEQIRINEAFFREAEENLRITRLREEVGVGTQFDVLRAEVQLANARQSITQAQSQREIAQRQLSRRLNIPPSITVTTVGVEVMGSWPLSLEESIVMAYQNRAELEQFLTERDLNEAQRQAALARSRPSVGLFAQYNFQALLITPEGVPTSTNDGFSVGAELAWRLFDGGGTQARAAQSELDTRIDEFEFENARNTIRVQVEEAYYTLQANLANIDTAALAVTQARQALELANLRFEAGVGTQTEVLNATSELTQAEGNLVRAKLDYNRALARLERAVSNLNYRD